MNGMPAEFERKIAFSDWQLKVEDQKEGVKLWQRKAENGLEGVKVQGIIDEAPEDIMTVLTHSRKYKAMYDKNYDISTQVKRIADQMFISYAKAKSVSSKLEIETLNIGFVSPRDMLLIVCPRKMADGTYYYIMYSYDKNEIFPVPNGIVRSRVQVRNTPSYRIDCGVET